MATPGEHPVLRQPRLRLQEDCPFDGGSRLVVRSLIADQLVNWIWLRLSGTPDGFSDDKLFIDALQVQSGSKSQTKADVMPPPALIPSKGTTRRPSQRPVPPHPTQYLTKTDVGNLVPRQSRVEILLWNRLHFKPGLQLLKLALRLLEPKASPSVASWSPAPAGNAGDVWGVHP